jgi:UPF0755 protein
MEIGKTDNSTDIFSDLAGGNKGLRDGIMRVQALWQKHVNRRTAAVGVVVVILGVLVYVFMLRPPTDFPTNVLVTVEEGATLQDISTKLQGQHVVRSASAMRMATKIYGVDRTLHSGDYLFKAPVNMLEVVKRIGSGAFGLEPVKVRVREGATVAKIAEMLDKEMLKFDKDKFLTVAGKHEGYLFPDTYYFLPNAPVEQVVGAMTDNFYKHYAEVEEQAKKTGYTMHQVVTLASILELEASKYTDRRKIAGVMYNRLEAGMALQVDVSFVYIMNKGTFDITREDLKHDSPYNTYVHKGLPPGPIGSPSMESLRAAVDPVDSNWIFYLADRRGVTHYSKTYKEHLRKKRWYIDKRR